MIGNPTEGLKQNISTGSAPTKAAE